MYLKQVDVVGFRGLNRLSLQLRSNMVLIGENAWGKSSLLDILSLVLNPEKRLYQFKASDFHLAVEEYQELSVEGAVPQRNHNCMVLFTFSESQHGEKEQPQCRQYRQLFSEHEDGYARIYLRISGELRAGKTTTEYSFLNAAGDQIQLKNAKKLILLIISRHPVFRFRDARLQRHYHTVRPFCIKGECEGDVLQEEIRSVALLLQYYFLDNQDRLLWQQQMRETSKMWGQVKSLSQRLMQDKSGNLKKRVLFYLSSMFERGKGIRFSKQTRPIILFEDLETRLHPRMVAIGWELASHLPIQRITTSNSVELLAYVRLEHICRLVRYENQTKAFQLSRRDLGKEDMRRLSFHVHYNRSLALFSRIWLMVEGETEVWILTELAHLLNINLEMEGIRIIEFAQSGLRPLIKYCKKMGIEWFVLTDGDSAGWKYSDTVKNLLEANESVHSRLLTLPKRDIEHFFYSEGFENVFYRLANHIPQRNQVISKIIQRAIQRSSKPDLALALADEMEKRGANSIPLLFKQMFYKIMQLSKQQERV
ncbi:DUF2813 domain-containing protein [Testudinibacter sp. TR-2022]|uniref:DUF2813 domain-containing protein n=1 Tax=Testudinibacter sp. TR-2022 TaxID=2585029 RepID=UPI00111B893D|nr:DUF2813 domain-containing protein [Testudinibacter sp. TR-2022]TNH06215.1 DUF2813 domain-containing protein [Pasteurellaceae bacterium Phil11]TNH23423.1 DUF2813 domain-containing protein [Testudinibacter sp. TR-2022]TNH23719.1 DUF2813 domain-containing protein [Testudinibacter sp. TR-2022]